MNIHFETIDSTNKYVKDHHNELDNFSFVSASFQTRGKGRETRKWESNKDENLLFSILIKDKNIISKFSSLSVCIAGCIASFIEKKLNISNVSIKWPNDVYINDKKVCGILLEGSIPEYIVIGIGLNVNQTSFGNDLRHPATSLKNESKKDFNVGELKEQIYQYIYACLNDFDAFINNSKPFIQTHNFLLNKEVSIGNLRGVVSGFNDDFKLVLDNQVVVDTGEASVVINTK